MIDCKKLNDLAEHLFEKKKGLDSFHQEVATHFYPERADFTQSISIGEEWGTDIMSSFPVLMRRDLGNQIGMMLRPRTRDWFHIRRMGGEEPGHEAKEFMEWFEKTQRRAMYDPLAQMLRATSAGDHDFATFGQCALSVTLGRDASRLLYRSWHLRDLAWQEDAEGQIGFVTRKWEPTLQQAIDTFGEGKLSSKLVDRAKKAPFDKVCLKHFVVPSDMVDEPSQGQPRWSVWYDADNDHKIEYVPIWGKYYIIPRWVKLSSQYAHSPAVTAALPDARLIQAMTFTLLEAGEKSTNPPMIAKSQVVQTTPAMFAGGITWIDKEHDERLGDAIRPFPQDYSGVRHGMEMSQHTEALIREAFFLNKLSPFNPAQDPQMTAFQAGQYVQEYVRNAMPIFEPMEAEYNAALCEETFGMMLRAGAFGSPLDWPRELHNMEIEFQFESPLHDAVEREKGQQWLEAKALLAEAMAVDPSAMFLVDAPAALRDALEGVGVPTKWLRSEQEVEDAVKAHVQRQQQEQMLAAMQQGSEVAQNLAGAREKLQPL